MNDRISHCPYHFGSHIFHLWVWAWKIDDFRTEPGHRVGPMDWAVCYPDQFAKESLDLYRQKYPLPVMSIDKAFAEAVKFEEKWEKAKSQKTEQQSWSAWLELSHVIFQMCKLMATDADMHVPVEPAVDDDLLYTPPLIKQDLRKLMGIGERAFTNWIALRKFTYRDNEKKTIRILKADYETLLKKKS